jgi:hypothetical protein
MSNQLRSTFLSIPILLADPATARDDTTPSSLAAEYEMTIPIAGTSPAMSLFQNTPKKRARPTKEPIQ